MPSGSCADRLMLAAVSLSATLLIAMPSFFPVAVAARSRARPAQRLPVGMRAGPPPARHRPASSHGGGRLAGGSRLNWPAAVRLLPGQAPANRGAGRIATLGGEEARRLQPAV